MGLLKLSTCLFTIPPKNLLTGGEARSDVSRGHGPAHRRSYILRTKEAMLNTKGQNSFKSSMSFPAPAGCRDFFINHHQKVSLRASFIWTNFSYDEAPLKSTTVSSLPVAPASGFGSFPSQHLLVKSNYWAAKARICAVNLIHQKAQLARALSSTSNLVWPWQNSGEDEATLTTELAWSEGISSPWYGGCLEEIARVSLTLSRPNAYGPDSWALIFNERYLDSKFILLRWNWAIDDIVILMGLKRFRSKIHWVIEPHINLVTSRRSLGLDSSKMESRLLQFFSCIEKLFQSSTRTLYSMSDFQSSPVNHDDRTRSASILSFEGRMHLQNLSNSSWSFELLR